ncbi:MAG: hypothetical protein HKM23_07630 [Nitrosopumilus sp.]|nr:hypothetical protein [Nitrosopumilus sp.]
MEIDDTPEGRLLAFLNDPTTTLTVLVEDAGIDPWAAQALLEARLGPDGLAGTEDDHVFEGIGELFAVSFVDFATVDKLMAYVWVQSGPGADVSSSILQLLNHPHTDVALLKSAGLGPHAAASLIAHRDGSDGAIGTGDDDFFDDLAEVAAQSWVGPLAMVTLEEFVATWVPPSADAEVLAFVNDPLVTEDVLDDQVGLTGQSAAAIIGHRNGPDGEFGTADDDLFDTVEELDAVPYVGPASMEKIFAFAPLWAVLPKGPPAVVVFLNDPGTTVTVLVDDVGISENAAHNLIAYRDGPDGVFGTEDDDLFDSIAEIDAVAGVGVVTLDALLRFP